MSCADPMSTWLRRSSDAVLTIYARAVSKAGRHRKMNGPSGRREMIEWRGRSRNNSWAYRIIILYNNNIMRIAR